MLVWTVLLYIFTDNSSKSGVNYLFKLFCSRIFFCNCTKKVFMEPVNAVLDDILLFDEYFLWQPYAWGDENFFPHWSHHVSMWELSWICRDHIDYIVFQRGLCISMKVPTLKHDVINIVEKNSQLPKH
jgi:hypothetical protein